MKKTKNSMVRLPLLVFWAHFLLVFFYAYFYIVRIYFGLSSQTIFLIQLKTFYKHIFNDFIVFYHINLS